MAQPQLDIPPISFARYLDLLKRRRWQVVPISIAGLLIGAIVAFLIPRFYVARTIIQFRGAVLDVPTGSEDPMKALLESAGITIRYSLRKALDELGWSEARSGSPDEQRAFEEDVRLRISVVDMDKARGRRTANLSITYKDTDGERAMQLTNTLRDVWLADQKQQLDEKAQSALNDILEQVGRANRAEEAAERQVHNYEVEFNINPQDWVGDRDGGRSDLSDERGAVLKAIKAADSKLGGKRAVLATKQDDLAQTRPTVETKVESQVPEYAKDILDQLQAQILYKQLALQRIREAHPHHGTHTAELQELTARLAEWKKLLDIDELEDAPNPAYVELLEEIDDLEGEIAELESTVAADRERAAELQEEWDRLPELARNYIGLLRTRQRAQEAYDALEEKYREVLDRKQALDESQAYVVLERANVPPRPTEPNITLVALAGSAVGLAVAIGLILLIDIMQSTFKTMEDVEHVLPVPVLGGMAHMETLEHRQHVHQRRTRAGVVAGVFLVLTLSVITIYYVWPSRLPSMVRSTLDMILGAPPTDSVK